MNIKKIAFLGVLILSQGMNAQDGTKKINRKPGFFGWLLMDIAEQKKIDMIDLFLAKIALKLGVNPNATERGDIWNEFPGRSAITDAASHGHTEYLDLLIKNGGDVELPSPWNGCSPLSTAVWNGKTNTAKLLIDKKANLNSRCGNFDYTPLMRATSECNPGMVNLLLNSGADVHMTDNEKKTVFDIVKKFSPTGTCAKQAEEMKDLFKPFGYK